MSLEVVIGLVVASYFIGVLVGFVWGRK
ncbi:MAG: hypothetical protein [Bacteriophage sp.]|nr:MAG: hypothetical protein [Bacteriophage sp.]